MFLYLNIQQHVEKPASTERTIFKIVSFKFREIKLNRITFTSLPSQITIQNITNKYLQKKKKTKSATVLIEMMAYTNCPVNILRSL